MKPALTKEEWAQAKGEGVPERSTKMILDGDMAVTIEWQNAEDETTGISYVGKERHALAALALYGQPFGFSREDVVALRKATDDAERWAASTGFAEPERYRNIDRCRALADRIEALLPPEE